MMEEEETNRAEGSGPEKEDAKIPIDECKEQAKDDEHMSKATFGHMLKTATEIMNFAECMIPKSKIPEEAKAHYMAAKKEMLLAARALIDAKIAEYDAEKTDAEEPHIRKISLD